MEKTNTEILTPDEWGDYKKAYKNYLFQIRNHVEICESELSPRDLEIYKLAEYTIDRCLDGIFITDRLGEVRKHTGRLEYPVENGIAVSPFELDLPKSELDLSNINNYSLHHNEWTEYKFKKNQLFFLFRKLETNQFSLPTDVHSSIHTMYNPPILPTAHQAMAAIDHAASHDIRLRTGSVQSPKFQTIDNKIYQEAFESYEKLTKSAKN